MFTPKACCKLQMQELQVQELQGERMNWLAIIGAGVASWVFGAVWYGLLSKRWMAATGLTEEQITGSSGKPSPLPYAISFVLEIFMAFGLFMLLVHVYKEGFDVSDALYAAFAAWLAFVAPPLTINHRYSMQPWSLTAIDGLHWLGVLLVQGVVLGVFL
ncbi:MAG: DUF1761 domain-containing protein [Pseudomonadota bacterium]